jgi:hypothetical protein
VCYEKTTAIIFTVLGMTATGAPALATESGYVPWTFDDFNSNCEVVESIETPSVKPVAIAAQIPADEDVGELGW